MSTEDERSVAPDLFSAAPVDTQVHPAPARYEYVPAGGAGAAHQFAPGSRMHAPPPEPFNRPGWMRRALPYIAVAWGVLNIVLFFYSQSVAAHEFTPTRGGYYRGGQMFGLIFAAVVLYLGWKEISSHHIYRSRALPWLMGFLAVMLALVIAATLMLPRHYPASVRANFLSSCQSHGGSAALCGCALSWYESHESLSEYLAVDAYIRAGNPAPGDIAAAIASSCGR